MIGSEKWMNPSISWKNKWKNDGSGTYTKEKFFGSSTFLVWLTDFWHFSKAMMILSICLSIICYKPIINNVTGETIQLKPYEVPESITFLDTIPRTKADKADYKLLEELAKEEAEHKTKKRELK